MSPVQRLWMGYSHDGGRATLDVGGPASKVILLGSKSRDLAALVAFSAKEEGVAPTVFDLDGSLANCLSGYLDTFDYRSFLYDSFRLEEPGAWHSQLAAAAYTLALDLSSEEEAIINSAMQVVASDGTLLSPVSLRDIVGKVEGFRGFYVDKLNGKIGALRLFDAVEDEDFGRLVQGNVIVDFHGAPYPQAAELSAVLFLAKLLAVSHSSGRTGDLLLITEAHRLFKSSPRLAHSSRLLTHLLDWHVPTVVSSGQQQFLDPLLLRSCPIMVCSGDAWHSYEGRPQNILPGFFVLRDLRSNRSQTFVPRRVPTKTADYASGKAGRCPNPGLTRLILEEIDRFPLCTPESVARYIAPEFLAADVASALSALEKQGCLLVEPKDSGSGPKVFAYTLSDRGRRLLDELRH